MKAITENTLIPLSLVMTFIGGIFWLTAIFFKTEAHGRDIDQLKQYQLEVIHRLSRIEAKMEDAK